MNKENEQEFLEIINGVAEVYSKEMGTAAIDTYWTAVEDLTIEQFAMGIRRAVQKSEFFPTPAAVRKMVEPKGPEEAATNAWPEVMKLASRSSGEHSDPIAKEAIRLMGGGKTLGQTPKAELEKWGKKEFVRLYSETAERHTRDAKLIEAAKQSAGSLTDGN